MGLSRILITTGVPFVSAILYVVYVGFQRRSKVNELRKQGIAMPEDWSWWTGHLLVLQRHLDSLPSDANVYMAMQDLALKHNDTEVFLFDFWPVFDQVLMIYGPEASNQVSNQYNLPKPASQHKSMLPIVGGPSLISMNDKDWKFWRGLLNPGFSSKNMADRVPTVVAAVEVFCDGLRAKVDKSIFLLDDLTTRLTMDIITKATLDTDLDHQRSQHTLALSLNTILAWHSFWDPRILLNPIRPVVQWYHGRIMDAFIRKEIQQRFSEMKQKMASSGLNQLKHAKSVIALALEEYIAQKQQDKKETVEKMILDEDFARIAANQIRMFIFAGNDSTSSSIVYVYHCLSMYPDALTRLRQEHDHVFGTTRSAAAILKENPALLNQCRYTLAVIKETLRLYPPASSLRQGAAGVSITDRLGNVYPTADLGATIMHRFVHINPRFWPRPEEFLPERWLVEPGHELYTSPNAGAFRPFEHGPRNCIGQTLVYNEMRIVLILTARTFVIQPAYEEWDASQLANEGWLSRLARKTGLKGEGIKTVKGERAYQTVKPGSHPADGYPCRVTMIT